MATLAGRILQALNDDALDDDVLAARLGSCVIRSTRPADAYRPMVGIVRFQATGDKIVNRLATGVPAPPSAAPPARTPPAGRLSEDLVKQTLNE